MTKEQLSNKNGPGKPTWKKKKGTKKRNKNKCNLCGKRGHKEADCWTKESNASKRPAGWKTSDNRESADAGIDICLLCCCCGDEDSTTSNPTEQADETEIILSSTDSDAPEIVEVNDPGVDVRIIDLTSDNETTEVDSQEDDRVIDLSDDDNSIIILSDDENSQQNEIDVEESEATTLGYRLQKVMDSDGNVTYNKEEDPDVKDGQEVELVGKCPECNSLGLLGSFCTNCEDSGLTYQVFETSDGESSDEKTQQPKYYDSENSDAQIQIILANYVTIEKQINECNLDNHVKGLAQQITQGTTPNLKYDTTAVYAKTRNELTGRMWGRNIKDLTEMNNELSDPLIDDVTKCSVCDNYGLWGDTCRM